MNNKLIEFKNITKAFDTQTGKVVVLDDLNFSIERNSFTLIYGPSGSGKTTILNILLGLLQPTSGKVLVDGVDLYGLDNNQRALFRAKHFGTVAQVNKWVGSLNALENVSLPLLLSGSSYKEAAKKASDSIDRIGLSDFKNYHPDVMSIGQQQRISLARATVETPMLLVADEPTGSLDSQNGDMIMNIITKYKNEHNSTIILITHNMDYLSLSDNRIFIKDGKVEQSSGGFFKKSDEAKKIIKVTE